MTRNEIRMTRDRTYQRRRVAWNFPHLIRTSAQYRNFRISSPRVSYPQSACCFGFSPQSRNRCLMVKHLSEGGHGFPLSHPKRWCKKRTPRFPHQIPRAIRPAHDRRAIHSLGRSMGCRAGLLHWRQLLTTQPGKPSGDFQHGSSMTTRRMGSVPFHAPSYGCGNKQKRFL